MLAGMFGCPVDGSIHVPAITGARTHGYKKVVAGICVPAAGCGSRHPVNRGHAVLRRNQFRTVAPCDCLASCDQGT
jgi:hypothetical protein